MLSEWPGMSDAYSTLAKFYDLCMEVDYEEWVAYLLELSQRHQHVPQSIIDLGCGTGNLTIPLAKRGYQLTGVDLSAAMLAIAEQKARDAGLEIPLFMADLGKFQLPGKEFDTAISGCDVLNYLTTQEELQRAFQAVYRLLVPGGLWLFDLNSAYKLREIYGDQSYADLQTDFAYFWDNSYDEQRDLVTMELTFFVETAAGVYEKKTEQHRQKLWWPEEIFALAKETGFSARGCYDFLSHSSHSETSERWQFVLQRES